MKDMGGVIKIVSDVGDGIKDKLFGCCGTSPPEDSTPRAQSERE
jgi:hypothetical protein